MHTDAELPEYVHEDEAVRQIGTGKIQEYHEASGDVIRFTAE